MSSATLYLTDIAVRRSTPIDTEGLSVAAQTQADAAIASMEEAALRGAPTPLFDAELHPAMPEWMALRKSALALHPLYRAGSIDRLAHGLSNDVFRRPFDGGPSATRRLQDLLGSATSARVAERHEQFLAAPMTFEARQILAGSADARAIRSRAHTAAELIVARSRDQGWTTARVASIACGAAGPVAETAARLENDGVRIDSMTLLDRDPMALAAAREIATRHFDAERLLVRQVNLLDNEWRSAVDLKPLAGPGWDVVDILGLFEYLPDDVAIDLVRRSMGVTRPGGIVVVANMLDVRPQQTFFREVIQWPAVIQRSVEAFVSLLRRAGASPEQLEVVLPDADPVYAVASIRLPR